MTTGPVLLITRDEALLEDLLRLAAAAGVELDVAHDTTAALRSWPAACAVLVGADQVAALAGQRPPRRDQVHVVVRGAAPDAMFRFGLLVGARDVVEIPAAETWLVELLTDLSDGGPSASRTIGVVAGCGGAGATTFACALALTASRTAPAALLDLDPFGPGVDRVVGLEETAGVRWGDLLAASGRLGSRALREALPCRDGLAVLGWGNGPAGPLEAVAVREVLSAAQRGHPVVVVDLPRTLDQVTAEVAARCDLVVVVALSTVPGAAAAAKVVNQVRSVTSRLALLVRSGAPAVPAQQMAAALDLPLLAEMPRQRRLVEDIDLGLGPVRSSRSPLARAARAALRTLGDREAA
jgi:secretion/DNA translocation related CpaE-like protein